MRENWRDSDAAAGIEYMKSLGIDPSGHSVRIGVAQDMVSAGFSLPEIMLSGGWKSPEMVSRYSEHLQVRKGAAAKLAAKQNRT